jgi:phosphate-selective porin OprO/OprP
MTRNTGRAVALGLLLAAGRLSGQDLTASAEAPAAQVDAALPVLEAPAPGDRQAPEAEYSQQPAAPAAKPKKPWYEWENKLFTTSFAFLPIWDIAGFVQDDVNVRQVGDIPTKGKWRAERLMFFGSLKLPHPWSYFIGVNYNSIEDPRPNRWSFLDLRLDIPVGKLGWLRIGKQKVGVSQEWIMPGNDWVFMERSTMNNSFVPQRNVGLMLTNTFAKERGMWSAGWFNDWFTTNNTFSGNGNGYSARVSFLPVDADNGATVVQVAAAVYYQEATNGKLQFKGRPEVNDPSPYFVDTGSFKANHSTTVQFETMTIKGPLQLFGELEVTPVSAPQVGDPFFWGGYVGASYFLTGEHRSFNRRNGTYNGSVKPQTPFTLRHGGLGAWEVAGRYSYVDLTDAAVKGGTESRWTCSLAWYPQPRWRFEFNYGYVTLENPPGTRGQASAFSERIQWQIGAQ